MSEVTYCDVCKYNSGKNCLASEGEFGECKPAQELLNKIEKQGAVEELKKLLEEMDFSQNRAECGFCDTIEQVDAFIEYVDFEKHIKKRLKQLREGV
jgi:hypothetical protein